MLNEYLALVAGGVCISGPHGSETVAAVLGRLPPPGHCTDSRMKHITSFLMKKAYLLVLQIQPERQVSVYYTPRGYQNALREWGLGDTILALSLDLATAHWYLLGRSS